MRITHWISAMILTASLALAQDEAALRSAMKQIGPATGALGKKIAAKDASAAADAKKLAEWFGPVEQFFKAKMADTGVNFAKTASTEFAAAGKLAGEGKWDEAGATFKKATGTCSGCHGMHREKAADGSWKVK
jgi:hypothetical protein